MLLELKNENINIFSWEEKIFKHFVFTIVFLSSYLIADLLFLFLVDFYITPIKILTDVMNEYARVTFTFITSIIISKLIANYFSELTTNIKPSLIQIVALPSILVMPFHIFLINDQFIVTWEFVDLVENNQVALTIFILSISIFNSFTISQILFNTQSKKYDREHFIVKNYENLFTLIGLTFLILYLDRSLIINGYLSPDFTMSIKITLLILFTYAFMPNILVNQREKDNMG